MHKGAGSRTAHDVFSPTPLTSTMLDEFLLAHGALLSSEDRRLLETLQAQLSEPLTPIAQLLPRLEETRVAYENGRQLFDSRFLAARSPEGVDSATFGERQLRAASMPRTVQRRVVRVLETFLRAAGPDSLLWAYLCNEQELVPSSRPQAAQASEQGPLELGDARLKQEGEEQAALGSGRPEEQGGPGSEQGPGRAITEETEREGPMTHPLEPRGFQLTSETLLSFMESADAAADSQSSGIRTGGIRTSGIRTSGIRTSGIRTSGIRTSGIRTSGIRSQTAYPAHSAFAL
jgi:hypothetical protein